MQNSINTLFELDKLSLMIGGDFNAVWLHSLDKTGITESREQHLASKALRKWATECLVVDTWPMLSPPVREFTCFSLRHQFL